MSRNSAIGGAMTHAAYALLAQRHRPQEPHVMAAEVRRLHADGLTPRDISTALQLPMDEVINTINPASICNASTACPSPRSAGVGGPSAPQRLGRNG